MTSVSISIKEEPSYKNTIVSVSHIIETPLIEGNAKKYEIMVPEKNDIIPESVLESAKKERQRIAIRPERLAILLDVEKKLSLLNEKKQKKLEELHSKEKLNPLGVHDRMKRYVETHRNEINARRREKRKLEKETTKSSNIIIIKRVIQPAKSSPICETQIDSTKI
jgi:hypothetical protein